MRKTKILLTLILAAMLIPAIWLNTRTGVTIHDQFLYRRSSGEFRSVSGWSILHDESENTFTARLGSQTFHARAELNGDFARFTFEDGTVTEGRWDNRFGLVDSQGVPISFSDNVEIIVGDELLRYYLTPGAIACEFCRIAMDETEPRGHIGLILCGIALYALGAAHFLWPESMHFLFSRWRYQNAELSADGVFAEKAGAVLLMLIAAGVMFAPLFV